MLIGVRADYQTRGYGRRLTEWYAPPRQCLLVSYVVPLRETTSSTPAILALAGSVVVAEAIERMTGLHPRLRWPNDVLLRSRKVAGVLVELVRLPDDVQETRWAAVMGIGVNVNVLRWPPELARTAISLRQATARPWSTEQMELTIRTGMGGMPARLGSWTASEVLDAWQRRDVTPGGWYLVETEGGTRLGKALGVTPTGRLLIRLTDGSEMETINARHAAGYAPPQRT